MGAYITTIGPVLKKLKKEYNSACDVISEQEDELEKIQKTNTKNYDNYHYNKKTSQELRVELNTYKEEFKITLDTVKRLQKQDNEAIILLNFIHTTIKNKKAKEAIDNYLFNEPTND